MLSTEAEPKMHDSRLGQLQCCQVYDNYRICMIILPSVWCMINNPKKRQIYDNLNIPWMCGCNRLWSACRNCPLEFFWEPWRHLFPCDKFPANHAFLNVSYGWRACLCLRTRKRKKKKKKKQSWSGGGRGGEVRKTTGQCRSKQHCLQTYRKQWCC